VNVQDGGSGAGRLPPTYSHGSPHAGNDDNGNRYNVKDVFTVTKTLAEKFKFAKKVQYYEQREELRDDLEFLFTYPQYASKQAYIVLNVLRSAAKKGGAPSFVVAEIEHIHKNGVTGLDLLTEVTKRFTIDTTDRVDDLLKEYAAFERRSDMTLRETLYAYSDLVRRMQLEENHCLPADDVQGKKLLSFAKTDAEQNMLVAMYSQEDIESESYGVNNLTRNPKKLLQLLNAITLKHDLLKAIGSQTKTHNPFAGVAHDRAL
jgi:hypothetical protein